MEKIKLGKIILVLFSFFGIFILQIVIHENFHKFDFKNIEKISDETCYLNFNDDALGYYQFYPNGTSQYEEIEEIKKYTELKAYSLSTIVIIFYVFFLIKFVFFEK